MTRTDSTKMPRPAKPKAHRAQRAERLRPFSTCRVQFAVRARASLDRPSGCAEASTLDGDPLFRAGWHVTASKPSPRTRDGAFRNACTNGQTGSTLRIPASDVVQHSADELRYHPSPAERGIDFGVENSDEAGLGSDSPHNPRAPSRHRSRTAHAPERYEPRPRPNAQVWWPTLRSALGLQATIASYPMKRGLRTVSTPRTVAICRTGRSGALPVTSDR